MVDEARFEAQRQRRQAVAEQIPVEAAADAFLVKLASRLREVKTLLRRA